MNWDISTYTYMQYKFVIAPFTKKFNSNHFSHDSLTVDWSRSLDVKLIQFSCWFHSKAFRSLLHFRKSKQTETMSIFNVKILFDTHEIGWENDYRDIIRYFKKFPHIKIKNGHWQGLTLRSVDFDAGFLPSNRTQDTHQSPSNSPSIFNATSSPSSDMLESLQFSPSVLRPWNQQVLKPPNK